MPFKGNESEVPVIKSRQLFCGVANWKVVALNPNEELREKLKITQNIKEYTGKDRDDNVSTRLDFWLKLRGVPYPEEGLVKEDLKGMPLLKLSIFVADRELLSEAKNYSWINKIGQTTWADTAEKIANNPNMTKWYDATNLRKAIAGEDQLTQFLIALINVNTRLEGTECRLVDPKKIAKGDLSEIKGYLKDWPNNTIQCLLGVKKTDKGNFQDFYKDFFARSSSKTKTLETWSKKISDDRNGLEAERYKDLKVTNLKFEQWEADTKINQGSEEGAAPATSSNSIADGDLPDDLPF